MSVNILILASSIEAVDKQGTQYCPCLAEISGVSVLEKVISNTNNVNKKTFTLTGLDSDLKSFKLDHIISILLPESHLVSTMTRTAGSLCTALLAASKLNQDDELLIVSMNELVDLDYSVVLENFRDNSYDGGVITFDSIHPRYSFARLEESVVTEISQHEPISRNATTGSFWFQSTRDFVEGAKNLILKGVQSEGSFYIAPVYNELILARKLVGAFEIDKRKYFPLKYEVQLNDFSRAVAHGI